MKKGIRLFLVAGLSLVGFSGFSAINNDFASAEGSYRIDYHNEYRVWSPNDRTYSDTKWTKSAYLFDCTSMSGITNFTAWAMSNGTDVSDNHYYNVKEGSDIELYNLAVETYGYGVSAWVAAQKFGNGSADGSWQPDKR